MIKAEILLFSRWLITHYDNQYLNNIDGDAWNELYEYFKKIVLPNYKRNGTYKNAKEFYAKPNIPVRLKIIEKIKKVPLKTVYVPYESNGCDCGQPSCNICN